MMRTAILLPATLFVMLAVAPLAAAGGPDVSGCYQVWQEPPPLWNETCGDLEYVAGHWVTEIGWGIAMYAVDSADCLSGADPYNWAPSDYVDCTGLEGVI